MNKLKKTIEEKGVFINEDVLKVDSFLNHQIDVDLVEEMGQQFYEHFKDAGITKVVTIESSGIAPAYACARRLGTNMIFIKKSMPSTMIDPLYTSVYSFTKQKEYPICIEKGMLAPDDRVLFIDDFLANGEAFKGAEQLIRQTGAQIAGIGICIEKRFQKGHDYIVKAGYDLYSLASIASTDHKKIKWA